MTVKAIFSNAMESVKSACYLWSGAPPWSPGYVEFRNRTIRQHVLNFAIVDLFFNRESLPDGFGIGLDERAVEYPWILSRLRDDAKMVLDAGAILNHRWLLELDRLRDQQLVIYTLAPEDYCCQRKNVSYVYGDLRKAIIRDQMADSILCVSTLEHVGMDNTIHYSSDHRFDENSTDDYLLVLEELHRIAEPNGQVLVTVPFGKEQRHTWFQQFTPAMISRLLNHRSWQSKDITFYRYCAKGWQLSNMDQCVNAEYFDVHKEGRVRTEDGAAAARAVACIEFKK